ncbi:ISX-like protein [Mya arenaria]|uniref:ISX-like protein n=1 Tax=Mya arenaria TaxID=6604 RepID=A0ABY7FWU4_MYAAR|nr:ISX-like protein [Mya arenaria]
MHDNILQPFSGRSHQPSYGGFSSLEDIFPRKTSAIVQPMPVLPVATTPEKENMPFKPFNISPVFPGTGSFTHNVTSMLSETGDTGRREGQLPSTASRATRFSPYSTAHFLSYRQRMIQGNTSKNDDDHLVDVVAESGEQLRNADAAMTDSSMSTVGSASPQSSASSSSPSGSSRSSPGSGAEAPTSPETTEDKNKKKVRTCYTNEQVQGLMKIFHDNPYPDSEYMERIAKEMGVGENKIKIWFQNKRARWRRRVNDTMNTYPSGFMPMTPAMSPVHPYGYMTPGHMMAASSPQHMASGYFNPWMQTNSLSPNNNSNTQLSMHQIQSRLPPTKNLTTGCLPNQAYPAVTMTPSNNSIST